MSAEQAEAPAAEVPAAEGPKVITLIGQEAPAAEAPKTPAEEPKEAPKAAGSEEPAESNRDDKGRFKSNPVQDRIDELTRARREAEREAEYWRVRATGEAPGQKAPAQPTAPQAPVRDNFKSDAEYLDAKAEYLVEQKLAQREAQAAQTKEATTKAEAWQQKLAAARTEIADFDTVMNGSQAPVAAHVAELIMEHDQGAKVAHFYAANPEALEKINAMSPAKAAFEIGKVAAKFEEAAAARSAGSSEPAAEVRVSKAPPPASRTVGAGAATSTKLEDMGMDDYVAARKKQGARWAR